MQASHTSSHLVPTSIFHGEEIGVAQVMGYQAIASGLEPRWSSCRVQALSHLMAHYSTAQPCAISMALLLLCACKSNLINACIPLCLAESLLCSPLLNSSKAPSPFLFPSCPSYSG